MASSPERGSFLAVSLDSSLPFIAAKPAKPASRSRSPSVPSLWEPPFGSTAPPSRAAILLPMTRRLPKLSALLVLALASAPMLHAQAGAAIPPPVFLWPNGAPGTLGNAEADKPRMYAFLPKTRSTSAAVLVIPGGGYEHVAMGHEGFQIATWLNAQGIPAFVLDYRVKPYRYPVEIDDGRRAMRLIRAHAAEYGINPNRLGVWGSSAGGHLRSSLGTHCEKETAAVTNSDLVDAVSCKPDFM